MRRGRGAQAELILGILSLLSRTEGGVTLADIAGEVGISERTARRYVQDIASVYLPVERVTGADRRARWRFVAGHRIAAPLTLGLGEVLALERLRAIAASALARPWRVAINGVFERLEGTIPHALRHRAEQLLSTVGVAPATGSAEVRPSILRAFEEAAQARQALAVRYRSLSGPTRNRRFDPYIVYLAEGSAYAYGLDHQHEEARTLALARVLRAGALSATFERPHGFAPGDFLGRLHRGYEPKRPTRVVLRARGRAARLLQERPESPDQQAERLPERGAWRITFTAPNTRALRARLLGLGHEVEVEAPKGLRRRMADTISRMARTYGADAADAVEVEARHPAQAAARTLRARARKRPRKRPRKGSAA